MAATLSELIAGINAKCDILLQRCRDLEIENNLLKTGLKESNNSLEVAKKELADARRQINYLEMASNFDSGSRDSSRQSSKLISDMVRKLDRCISRLEAE